MEAPISIENYHYEGFHGVDSKCSLKVWPSLNTAMASHEGFHGTSPTNRAEKLALKVCEDYKLNIKKLNWIIHIPKDHSPSNKEEFSLIQFVMGKKKGKMVIDEVKTRFLEIHKATIKDYLNGLVKLQIKHKIKFNPFL